MDNNQFKYIIVGAGTAGLHLINSMVDDKFFKNKKILLIDKSFNKTEEKCFSYWEKGEGKWDKIITKSWLKSQFITEHKKINLKLKDYTYKMIKSNDFYEYVKKKVSKYDNIELLKDDILKIRKEEGNVIVVGSRSNYVCDHVFDSRITENIDIDKHISLKQHFKGWVIKTKESVFKPKTFTIMDYRIGDNNKTSFTYVLPISKNKALIEYTYFTPNLVDSKEYDHNLHQYINEILKIKNYKIINQEYGIIPMTNFPFFQQSIDKITKIGTAGGWVKPSTGYSFKNCERNSDKIVKEIKNGNSLIIIKSKAKYYHMDKIFLDVLYRNNEFGKKLFYLLFAKNKTDKIFKFLDEQSNFLTDLQIINSLFSVKFIISFFRHLTTGFKPY
tara:strand:- start:484 stop:1644 length:1161 start_codon:yes stop_codon:yes gene_type:complete